MHKEIIKTAAAPEAIGTYSQAIKIENTVYISGQIPLDPSSMELVITNIDDEIHQVFKNLKAVTEAAGGSLSNIVKLGVYLTNLDNLPILNNIMELYFSEPYPARAAIGVSQLPKGANVEMDAIMVITG